MAPTFAFILTYYLRNRTEGLELVKHINRLIILWKQTDLNLKLLTSESPSEPTDLPPLLHSPLGSRCRNCSSLGKKKKKSVFYFRLQLPWHGRVFCTDYMPWRQWGPHLIYWTVFPSASASLLIPDAYKIVTEWNLARHAQSLQEFCLLNNLHFYWFQCR